MGVGVVEGVSGGVGRGSWGGVGGGVGGGGGGWRGGERGEVGWGQGLLGLVRSLSKGREVNIG